MQRGGCPWAVIFNFFILLFPLSFFCKIMLSIDRCQQLFSTFLRWQWSVFAILYIWTSTIPRVAGDFVHCHRPFVERSTARLQVSNSSFRINNCLRKLGRKIWSWCNLRSSKFARNCMLGKIEEHSPQAIPEYLSSHVLVPNQLTRYRIEFFVITW